MQAWFLITLVSNPDWWIQSVNPTSAWSSALFIGIHHHTSKLCILHTERCHGQTLITQWAWHLKIPCAQHNRKLQLQMAEARGKVIGPPLSAGYRRKPDASDLFELNPTPSKWCWSIKLFILCHATFVRAVAPTIGVLFGTSMPIATC